MKKNEQIHTDYMKVTPQMAEGWLTFNLIKNRRLTPSVINRYAADMRSGDWIGDNGETVKFTRDGTLVDGQHRLHAIAMTGVPQYLLVAFNVHEAAFSTVDAGKKRGFGDVLSIDGCLNSTLLGATLSWLIKQSAGGLHVSVQITNQMILAALPKYPGVEDSVSWATAHRTKRGNLAPSLAAFLHYELSRAAGQQKAEEFLLSLIDGVSPTGKPLYKSSPSIVLRARLEANSVAKAKLGRTDVVALCIKAWNAHMAGRKIKALKWARNAGERFPTVAKPA